MTYSDFINSYGFKHAIKLLKKKFPWVTKIEIDPYTYHTYKNIIYLDVYINTETFIETMEVSGESIPNWNSEYGWSGLDIIFDDIDRYESKKISKEIEDVFTKVQNNEAIPKNANIPKRYIAVNSFFIDQN